ncbi:MAG: T9SS type A sorting domain-containing protein [Bacteroidales bacterium]|nr:T9SS type A sorting domain-containing protein [Bacteroidales bacterium]
MKILFTVTFLFVFVESVSSQQFLWADSYDISNCNEVAALAVDADSNVYITGIHNAPVTLPFKGDAYLLKTSFNGEVLRTDSLLGELLIGDMATVGTDVLIVGQSYGDFEYRDEFYGSGQYFMFMLMLDADGNRKWYFSDESKSGTYANISVGNTSDIAVHIRSQSNLADWILIMDNDGNILKSRVISPSFTLVSDIAFYDNKLYFNGGFNGPGSVTVDTILIQLPPTQNASITMGFDEDLIAQWLFTDETFSNITGRIVANDSGLFVYEQVVEGGFTPKNTLKKFSFGGQLIDEAQISFFSNTSSIRADMVSTPSMIGLFPRNSFNNQSHKVMLFNHNLGIETEKVINGPSSPYPGQIAALGDKIFVSHIHSGQLNFDNELILPYSGAGQKPYIAGLDDPTVTGITQKLLTETDIFIYPNPAADWVSIKLANSNYYSGRFEIYNIHGLTIISGKLHSKEQRVDLNGLAAGIYSCNILLRNTTTGEERAFAQKLMVVRN